MPNQKGYRRAAIIFLCIWLVFLFVPLITMVVWAFAESWRFPDLLPSALSLRAMTLAANNSGDFGGIIVRSIVIAVIVALLCVLVASLTARALVHFKFPGNIVWRFAVILPFIIPSAAFAMGVQSLFAQWGLSGTIPGVILAVSIGVLPYATSIMMDVTAAAGKKMEEQAIVLGANWWQRLRFAIVPSLLPGILAAFSLSYILAFMSYFVVYLVGTGMVKTLAVTMFPLLAASERTIACAYATVFVGISLLVFFLFNLIMKWLGIKESVDLFS